MHAEFPTRRLSQCVQLGKVVALQDTVVVQRTATGANNNLPAVISKGRKRATRLSQCYHVT